MIYVPFTYVQFTKYFQYTKQVQNSFQFLKYRFQNIKGDPGSFSTKFYLTIAYS